MRVHIVANLTARGLSRGNAPMAWLRDATRGRAQLHPTSALAELAGTMRGILDDGVDLLILAGGDGTFMSGVSAMHAALRPGDRWPTVGLLPMGTVGTVARNIGERGKARDLLASWLRDPRAAHVLPQPTLHIVSRTADASIEERVGFIIGSGLVARFFEVYDAAGAKGLKLASRLIARITLESFTGGPLAKQVLTPLPAKLRVHDREHPAPGLSLVCAAVVPDMGLGMKVCYRAGEDPARIHLVASRLGPAQLGPRFPNVFMGRSIGGPDHVDELASSFELEFPGESGPYVVDGDLLRAKHVRVSPGPIVPIISRRR
ncbi:MAG: diacylglycerol kinase family protein [Polyangiaceae bacterium]